jgi:hypothetical protein
MILKKVRRGKELIKNGWRIIRIHRSERKEIMSKEDYYEKRKPIWRNQYRAVLQFKHKLTDWEYGFMASVKKRLDFLTYYQSKKLREIYNRVVE